MYKPDNFAKAADSFARDAQRQFSELARAIKSLRDNQKGLHSQLKVPMPKGGSRYSKTVRTSQSIFLTGAQSGIGSFISGSFLSDLGLSSGGSFYSSSSQSAAQLLDASRQAQRNR